MKRTAIISIAAWLACAAWLQAAPKGSLFIIGGGDRPESMMRMFVDLAGRVKGGKIVVLPMA